MNRKVKKTLLWLLIGIAIFAIFRWLFGLGIPDAALQFASGATVIVMAGLLAGHFGAALWYRAAGKTINRVLSLLALAVLLCIIAIGFLVNRMIVETRFNDFLLTVVALFLVCACLAAVITLVRHRIRSGLEATRSQLAQSRSELHFLQSQMSSHFLFNTLNNLYGFSLTDPGKVPALLLKLSELLRYSIYEARELFVPLSDEVDYIGNYIAFEKIRLGNRLSLRLSLPVVTDKSVKVAPMLLIVFVENAFKHARNNEEEKIFIDISLALVNNSIIFSVINSYVPAGKLSAAKNVHSGLGLDSVKKRLDLLYKERFDLQIIPREREYSVTLKLMYNENEMLDRR